MTNKNQTVAIVGSGIAGIASAIRLSVKGNKVDIFEANGYSGGKLSEIKTNGYRFDAGPSLFTLPFLVDELFSLAGENPRDYFNYEKLSVNCHYFYEDGTVIKAYSDEQKLISELSNKTGENPRNIEKYIQHSELLYENLSELFMFSSLNDLKIYFSKKALKAYLKIPKFGFFKSMNKSNKELFSSPKLVQLFNRYATYNGSDPFQTPATMNIIPHLEMSMGAYFPQGGMHSITQVLVGLAERLGVRFHYNSSVEEILVDQNRAVGIKVNGIDKEFDQVISNMDIVNSYKKLLPRVKQPNFLLNQPKSSSALIFYWGIKAEFPQLDLHNIIFSENYRAEFQHIFDTKSIYRDPTVYINITSKRNKKDAPSGCENWFVMINTPNNTGQNWEELIDVARERIIEKISRRLNVDFKNLIETEQILDPRSIESKTSSAKGALYGNSSNNLFSAFLRHANKSRRIKNLYFCGGSVHPGGGIPMCLSSAKILGRYF
ncbi:MAG: phytoene desaturase [Cyclobacteriaceae bacterium]